MPSRNADAAGSRLRLALDMYNAGESLKLQALKRSHPNAEPAAIMARLRHWVRTRPGADDGDAAGRSINPDRIGR